MVQILKFEVGKGFPVMNKDKSYGRHIRYI